MTDTEVNQQIAIHRFLKALWRPQPFDKQVLQLWEYAVKPGHPLRSKVADWLGEQLDAIGRAYVQAMPVRSHR